MLRRWATIWIAISALVLPHTAQAQDVILSSPDGAVEITGTLLGYNGEFYRVLTVFGELTIDGSGVVCDGPGCPNLANFVAEVTFAGSSEMTKVLLPALVQAFAASNGYQASKTGTDQDGFAYVLRDASDDEMRARFIFKPSNTDEGFADLLADEADIVMALREIRPEENKRAIDAGLGDMTGLYRSQVLALDALVPIVSSENPVQAISPKNLSAVFSGDITNWAELGGPDAPISVHLPNPSTGFTQAAEDLLLTPVAARLRPDIQFYDLAEDALKAVGNDPFAVGLASYASVDAAQILPLTGGCGFLLEANRQAIKTEDYPLSAPMFLYVPARRLPKIARDFMDFLQKPSAQNVVRRAGFVDLVEEQISLNQQGDRMVNAVMAATDGTNFEQTRDMFAFLKPMQRLSLTFRFQPGSSQLDAQSRSNVLQLVRMLETGQLDGNDITLVGFSDGAGAAGPNQRIALQRANAVRAFVLSASETLDETRVSLETAAFGEAMPMACDDSAWGRQANRRVEVWVR